MGIANSKEEMVSYGPRLKEIIVQPNEWTAGAWCFWRNFAIP